MANLLSRPRVSGNTRISPYYQILGTGVTRPVLLLGHADLIISGRQANEGDYQAYQVFNMQETLNLLSADINSPLVRALLEVYNSGCKDIWVYPVAPMSEYVAIPSSRFDEVVEGQNFYQRYYDRLASAYALMVEGGQDFFEVVAPIEAPFYDTQGVDFLTQLASFCSDSFDTTGSIALGVIGTRVPSAVDAENTSSTNYNAETITAMASDTRIAQLGDKGKFVSVVVGEGSFMHPQVPNIYSRSLEAIIGSMIATVPFDRSVNGLRLKGLSNLSHGLFSEDQLEMLAQAKLNPVYKTAAGRRGATFEVKLLTDNTTGQNGSDFWSISQMRIIAFIGNRIRDYGNSLIGEPNVDMFQEAVKNLLDDMRRDAFIVNYSLKITLEENTRAIVDLGITPMFGIKNIMFTVEVGPGA